MKTRYMITAIICWLLPTISLVNFVLARGGLKNLSLICSLLLSADSCILLIYVLISLKKLLCLKFNHLNANVYLNIGIFIKGISALHFFAILFALTGNGITTFYVIIHSIGMFLLPISAIIDFIIYLKLICIKINAQNIKVLWIAFCSFGILAGVSGTFAGILIILLNMQIPGNDLTIIGLILKIFSWTGFVSFILMGIVFYKFSLLEERKNYEK